MSYGWILAELGRNNCIEHSMSKLIDLCEEENPHKDWAKFRWLSFGDLSPLRAWIERPFSQEPPMGSINGLWFGIFNPVVTDETSADLYVCGSERFSIDAKDNDWATKPAWWPEARYAKSTIMKDIYKIAYRQGAPERKRERCLGNAAEYSLCLGYAAFAVRELLSKMPPMIFLGTSSSMGVAVGFDSGDFLNLGVLTTVGLQQPKKK